MHINLTAYMKLTDFFWKTEIRRNREPEEFHIYLKNWINSLKYSKRENSRPRKFYWCMLPHIFFWQKMTLILHNFFHKTYVPFSNLFYVDGTILRPKPDKGNAGEENYRPISLINTIAKILKKKVTNWIQHNIKRTICHDQIGFILKVNQGWFTTQKSINVIHHWYCIY